MIVPFNRTGPKPVIVQSLEGSDHILKVNEIISDLQKSGHKNIAVICRTARESKAAFEEVKKAYDARLIEKGTLTFENGINVVPTYLAKGIEFDAVIIYDSSSYTRTEERKLLYTACTRAMHELYVLSKGRLSPLLQQVDEQLYNLV